MNREVESYEEKVKKTKVNECYGLNCAATSMFESFFTLHSQREKLLALKKSLRDEKKNLLSQCIKMRKELVLL